MRPRMQTEVPPEAILLSVQEAATCLGIGRTRVRELLASGQLRSVRIGRCLRIHRADVNAFAERLRLSSTFESGDGDVSTHEGDPS